MECPACNKETVPGARFCQHCGTHLGPDGGLPPSQGSGPGEPFPEPVPAPEQPSAAPGAGNGEPAIEPPAAPILTTSEWGALTSGDAPPPPPDPELPPPDEAPGRPLFPDARPGTGWVPAMGLGALAFLVMLLFAVVLGVVAFLDGISVVDAAKAGALLFFAFHHVAVTVGFPTFDGDAAQGGQGDLGFGPIDISLSLSLALLTATLLALFLLYRAGRRAADQADGSVGLRLAQGAAVAVPYAVLSALLALVVRLQIDVPVEVREALGAGGQLTVSASPLQALVWPLVLGLVAGGLGGLASIRGAMLSEERGGRIAAALSGAGRGVLVTLIVGFAGLLVLAGLSPDLTASYLGEVTDGRSGLVLLVFTVLALPNMVVLGTALGMGGSIVAGEYLGTTEHVASLLRFPQSFTMGDGVLPAVPDPSPVALGMAPIGYFVFILVPLVAVLVAGRRAAQRADAGSAGEAAAAGALAGLLWAAALVVLGILAGISVTSSMGMGGVGEAQGGFIGPDLLLGAATAAVWGGLGGALGGILGNRSGGGAAPVAFEDPLHVDQSVVPGGATGSTGTTGFEGLAAERRRLEQPEEPAPEELVEEASSPDPEEALAEEPEAAERPDGGDPSEDHAFGFATPASQYGAPTEERTEVEEPRPETPDGPEASRPQPGTAGLPEPEPSPWSPPSLVPPPWESGKEEVEEEAPTDPPAAEPHAEAQDVETQPEAPDVGVQSEPETEQEPPRWSPLPVEESSAPEPGSEPDPEPWRPRDPEPIPEDPSPLAPADEASSERTSDEQLPSWAVAPESDIPTEEPATPWGGTRDPGEPERPEEPEAPAAPDEREQPEQVAGRAEPAASAPWEPSPEPTEAPGASEVPPWASSPDPDDGAETPTEDAGQDPWEPSSAPGVESEQEEDASWLFPPDQATDDGGDEEETPPWATSPPLNREKPGDGEPPEPPPDED